MGSELTRGEKVIAFIERYCIVPEGKLVGQPVELDGFQKDFILEVYDNPHGTDTGILSIARKNAKTGTIAFMLLAHLVGPEAVQNSRIISGAMSRDQAAEVYNLASKCVMLSDKLRPLIKSVPSSKKLIGLLMNVEYQAISAEGKTAHGKSPILAILDEVGQIRGPQSDFVDAITTAQGAYENPLLIYISTQAANDGDLFSIAIDDALTNKPPNTVCHVHTTPMEMDLLDEAGWRLSNPALGSFRSLKDMRKLADKASRTPSFENTFRNLNLNQRVSTVSVFVSKGVWESCGGAPVHEEGMVYYGGLDLSSRTDLTCFVLIGVKDKRVSVWPYFWTPGEGLRDRAHNDRQPYDIWVKDGYLRTTPGRTVDYEVVAREIADELADAGIELETLAFDRWRIDLFEKDCERAGVNFPLVKFGQGFRDMGPAVDKLEAVLLNGDLQHGGHPVLTMCAANAVTDKDPAGNRKLNKHRSSGRIDGMVALAMALGGAEMEPEDTGPSVYEQRGILEL